MLRLSSFLFCLGCLLCCTSASAQSLEQIRNMNLPLLSITTTDSVMPHADVANPPVEGWGVSITNNSYVTGRMVMTLGNDTLYDSGEYEKNSSGMKIKRRGNSTGANLKQHPYKLKLTKKADLLMRGDSIFRHKEWLLLSMYTWNIKMTNSESNILNVIGLLVSKIVDKEWTPDYEFVNVVLNDQYQGMYYLMEAVAKGDSRIDITKNGIIVEDDPFWWNEDIYFRTDRQSQRNAFTYKYPDSDDVNDSIQQAVTTYFNHIEEILYTDENSLPLNIDFESFAKWILIHDILGTDDAVGCNRFIYKKTLGGRQSLNSKLKMGPVWDYDSSFRSNIGWSHSHNYFYFTQLFLRDDFNHVYREQWEHVSPIILDSIYYGLDHVWRKYRDVFDENMQLHKMLYPREGKNTFRYQIDEVMTLMQRRVLVMDSLMNTSSPSATETPSQLATISCITDIHGHHHKPSSLSVLPKGIYILQFSDGHRRKTAVR